MSSFVRRQRRPAAAAHPGESAGGPEKKAPAQQGTSTDPQGPRPTPEQAPDTLSASQEAHPPQGRAVEAAATASSTSGSPPCSPSDRGASAPDLASAPSSARPSSQPQASPFPSVAPLPGPGPGPLGTRSLQPSFSAGHSIAFTSDEAARATTSFTQAHPGAERRTTGAQQRPVVLPSRGDAGSLPAGCRKGQAGRVVVSTGLKDLDDALQGGLPLGCVLLILEDPLSPLHLVLLRYFLAEGVAHQHPTFLASPLPDPASFLATLPAMPREGGGGGEGVPKQAQGAQQGDKGGGGEVGIRIAWQYRYLPSLDTQYHSRVGGAGGASPFCHTFDLRASISGTHLRRALRQCHAFSTLAPFLPSSPFSPPHPHPTSPPPSAPPSTHPAAPPSPKPPAMEGVCDPPSPTAHALSSLSSRLNSFLDSLVSPPAAAASPSSHSSAAGSMEPAVGRVMLQGLGAPPLILSHSHHQWALLRVIQQLRARLQRSKLGVAVITIPGNSSSSSSGGVWAEEKSDVLPKHIVNHLRNMADVVLETVALPETSLARVPAVKKDASSLASSLGLLRITKVRLPNTQVPHQLDASVLSVRLASDRRSIVCEGLQLEPLNMSEAQGPAAASSTGCSSNSHGSSLDF